MLEDLFRRPHHVRWLRANPLGALFDRLHAPGVRPRHAERSGRLPGHPGRHRGGAACDLPGCLSPAPGQGTYYLAFWASPPSRPAPCRRHTVFRRLPSPNYGRRRL